MAQTTQRSLLTFVFITEAWVAFRWFSTAPREKLTCYKKNGHFFSPTILFDGVKLKNYTLYKLEGYKLSAPRFTRDRWGGETS